VIGFAIATAHFAYTIPFEPEGSIAIAVYKVIHFSTFPWDVNLTLGLTYLVIATFLYARWLRFLVWPYAILATGEALGGVFWDPEGSENIFIFGYFLIVSNAVAGAWAWIKLVMWSIRDRRNRRQPNPEVFD
jgi:hypothetical protein